MATLRVPATLEQLDSINTFITQSTPPEFTPLVNNIQLVAEEILVNVFSYAYPDKEMGKAEITCRPVYFDGEPFLCLSVRDWGPPFNPFAEVPVPDLTLDAESRPIGGLGIYLIKSVTAHQAYSRHDDSNLLDMYFALPD